MPLSKFRQKLSVLSSKIKIYDASQLKIESIFK